MNLDFLLSLSLPVSRERDLLRRFAAIASLLAAHDLTDVREPTDDDEGEEDEEEGSVK